MSAVHTCHIDLATSHGPAINTSWPDHDNITCVLKVFINIRNLENSFVIGNFQVSSVITQHTFHTCVIHRITLPLKISKVDRTKTSLTNYNCELIKFTIITFSWYFMTGSKIKIVLVIMWADVWINLSHFNHYFFTSPGCSKTSGSENVR